MKLLGYQPVTHWRHSGRNLSVTSDFPDRDVPPSNENVKESDLGAYDIDHCPVILDVRKQRVVCLRQFQRDFHK